MKLTIVMAIAASFISSAQVIESEEIVITATSTQKDESKVSSAMTIKSKKEIQKNNPTAVMDHLRGETGVYVQSTGGGQGTPVIRGFIGSSVLVTVDGIRLNNTLFRPAPNQYFALVDPNNVEKMEVLRGAGSTLYGSDAMGGVINIITPTPKFYSKDTEYRASYKSTYNSAFNGHNERVEFERGKSGVGYRLGVTYDSADNLTAGGDKKKQINTNHEAFGTDFKYFKEWYTGDFLFDVQYYRIGNLPRHDSTTVGYAPGTTTPEWDTYTYKPQIRAFTHIRYRKYYMSGFIDQVNYHLAFQKINDHRDTQKFGDSNKRVEKNVSKLYIFKTQFISERKSSTFTYGLEGNFDRVLSEKYQQNAATGAVSDRENRFPNRSSSSFYSFFIQNDWNISKRWNLVTGLRHSKYHIIVKQDDRTDAPTSSIKPNNTSGNFALSFKATQNTTLMTNIGRSFRAPTIFDLASQGSRPNNRFFQTNTSLKPETTTSYDLGVKVHTNKVKTQFFVFHSKYEDRLDGVDTGTNNGAGEDVFETRNINSLDLYGAELGFQFYFNQKYRAC